MPVQTTRRRSRNFDEIPIAGSNTYTIRPPASFYATERTDRTEHSDKTRVSCGPKGSKH